MRKTLAYFLSIIILFTLGLVILHPSFLALADWLGPLLGSHIYTVFIFIYLLLARAGANEITWLSLNPGQSISLSYTIDPEKPGFYADTPAILAYTVNDIDASTASNTLQSIEKSPNPLSMLIDNYQVTTALLDMVSNGNGQILTLAISTVILLVALVDVFRFLRQRSNRDEQSLDELGSGLPLEESEDND